MNDLIFIQIASYRDPDLVNTLRSLVHNACQPELLRFCIAWQHDESETLAEFAHDSRCKILNMRYQESQGVCWARNQIQAHYSGEKYTLAIDSHHRFVAGWDVECKSMFQHLLNESSKPLLTSYVPPFDPRNDPGGRGTSATGMQFDKFTPEGSVFFKPHYLSPTLKAPLPARFFSGHFAFTAGSFCFEVPHDPLYYFHGEEINLSVRAFTHGYDLYHPHRIICWHEYTRVGRSKHWDDDATWHARNRSSHLRNRILFGMEQGIVDFGRYSLGDKRTLRDYERYAGINFAKRAVQVSTLLNEPPGAPQMDDKAWEHSFSIPFYHKLILTHEHKFVWSDNWQFLSIIYHDDAGRQLHRKDICRKTLSDYKEQFNKSGELVLESTFQCFSGREPKSWIVWPYSRSNIWLEKFSGYV